MWIFIDFFTSTQYISLKVPDEDSYGWNCLLWIPTFSGFQSYMKGAMCTLKGRDVQLYISSTSLCWILAKYIWSQKAVLCWITIVFMVLDYIWFFYMNGRSSQIFSPVSAQFWDKRIQVQHLSLSRTISHVNERVQIVNCSICPDARPYRRRLQPFSFFPIWQPALHVSPVRGEGVQVLLGRNHPQLSVVAILKLGITAKSSLTVITKRGWERQSGVKVIDQGRIITSVRQDNMIVPNNHLLQMNDKSKEPSTTFSAPLPDFWLQSGTERPELEINTAEADWRCWSSSSCSLWQSFQTFSSQ